MSFLRQFLSLLSSGAPWILLAFVLAAVFHEIASLNWVKEKLRGNGVMPPFYGSIAGILTPSWGSSVIPVGISLSRQGIAQGAVLGYILAAVAINPVALPMTYGLIGKEFTIAFLLTVLIGPTFLGYLFSVLSKKRLSPLPSARGLETAAAIKLEEFDDDGLYQRLKSGFKFSFGSLLISASPWIILGYALASVTMLLISIAPESIVSRYFADPGIVPLLVAAGFAAVAHIWGVGSIPFVASLVTMGLAPGAALVILTFGGASNLSCVLPALRFFGKRLTTVFLLSSLIMSLTGGYLLNLWLAPTLELRAAMRPEWILSYQGGGTGLLPACWDSAIDSLGQLGQGANATSILAAIWGLGRSGIFILVSGLLVWGMYRSATDSIRARWSGPEKIFDWGLLGVSTRLWFSLLTGYCLYDIVISAY